MKKREICSYFILHQACETGEITMITFRFHKGLCLLEKHDAYIKSIIKATHY